MADLEYGDRFAVYLTPDRGVRYLTNDFGIRTMELLSKEVMTIAELSEALGVSRSTAQSGLARMVRTGLLRTSHDPPQSENGRTVYWSCSVCIFRRFNYGDSEHIRDSALGSILRGNDQWFDLSMLVALALGRRGIDFSPILFLLGIHVGKPMAPVAPEGDAAKLIRDFTALLGFDHEVDVDPDLSKHLRITFAAQERFSETLFISPVVTGYLMAMLESRTGAVFSTDLSLEWDVASGTITTETSRFFGRPPFVRSDPDNGPNPMNLVPERPFAIYLVDGTRCWSEASA